VPGSEGVVVWFEHASEMAIAIPSTVRSFMNLWGRVIGGFS
jgi:hypothetical protein